MMCSLNIIGPIVVKCGYLHIVCYWEGEDLVDLRTKPRFTTQNRITAQESFQIGDIVEMSEGDRRVVSVEVFTINTPYLVSIWSGIVGFSACGWEGYRYKLEKV